jgi:hypothetical protein
MAEIVVKVCSGIPLCVPFTDIQRKPESGKKLTTEFKPQYYGFSYKT